MRSTVDIHDTLDRELRRKADALGLSFKEALNRVIAAGLAHLGSSEKTKRKRFRIKARACGFQPGIDIEHLNRISDELEDRDSFLKGKP